MVLIRIRDATRVQHEALEQLIPLGRPGLDPLVYRQVLVRFRGFYSTWEAEAERAARGPLAEVVAARRKLALLDADLRALAGDGESCPSLDPGRLPRLSAGDATLLGSMYVVEGATLGGQVISRELERSSGMQGNVGYSFFTSYGKATGQQWRTFVALLEELPESETEAAVQAAQDTFQAFHDWIIGAALLSPIPGSRSRAESEAGTM